MPAPGRQGGEPEQHQRGDEAHEVTRMATPSHALNARSCAEASDHRVGAGRSDFYAASGGVGAADRAPTRLTTRRRSGLRT